MEMVTKLKVDKTIKINTVTMTPLIQQVTKSFLLAACLSPGAIYMYEIMKKLDENRLQGDFLATSPYMGS